MTTSKDQFEQAKEIIYEYIRYLAADVAPELAIDAFYQLLWDRVTLFNEAGEVRDALTFILTSPYAKDDAGLQFINRSYYSICNLWHLDNVKRPYLEQLVGHLDQLSELQACNPETKKLRGLLQSFNHSDSGDRLRRQMRLAGYEGYDPLRKQHTGTVADILPEHFCIYRSATLSDDVSDFEKHNAASWWETGVGSRQLNRLRESHRELNSYMKQRKRGVTDLKNPSRLSDQELDECLTFYHPTRHEGWHERAQQFRQQLQTSNRSIIDYELVHDYLMESIRPLPKEVYRKLRREILTVLDRFEQGMTNVIGNMITLFTNLLDAVFLPSRNLVGGDRPNSNINRLRRSIEHAGYIDFVGVLLSIVLPNHMLKFDLEKKLGRLYSYYEKSNLEDVPWVVDFFEHINLALVLNAKPLRYFPIIERAVC